MAACATATPYRQAGDDGFGYRTQQIESNRYRVSFAGNSNTDKETVRNYLLYRSAQLTLDQGGDYFIVVNRDTEREVDQTTTSTGFGFGFGFPFGGFGGTTVSNRDRSYEAYGVITIHEGNKASDNPNAYDARQVEQNLEATVERPE